MKRLLLLSLILLALVEIRAYSVIADEIVQAQTAQAGQTAHYELEIRNETTFEHTYRLALTGLPDTLTAAFTQGGPVLDSVLVAANTYGLVTLRIDVPAGTPIGHYTATFTATRDDGLGITSEIALNVENTYAVQITSQNVNVTTFSGKEFTFAATAANTGAAPVTNLALTVNAPSKWVVRIEPAVVGSLEPGATVDYHVWVLVPASQVPIVQPVKLSLTSDQTSSPESTLMVRVQNSPSYLVVAGVVIAAAVAGVFVYFRIRGRR